MSKSSGQKFKSILAVQYLLSNSDAEHAVNSKDIQAHLLNYEIEAKRHSISRDITVFLDVLNLEYENEVDEADALGYEIEYDAKLNGYTYSSNSTYTMHQRRRINPTPPYS